MIDTSAFKKGACLMLRGEPVMIVDYQVSTPTARGANTIYRTRFRSLKTGQILSEAVRSGEKFEEVDLVRHKASYLYTDGSRWYFMDDESFEQFDFDSDGLAGAEEYLVDGITGLQAVLIDGEISALELPNTVEMTVVECDPTIKGATAQAQLKPAKTETGLELLVPPYLSPGERIRVDTRDGHFIERAKG